MNYIILDMEWNQPISKENIVKSPVYLVGEIIQIGAVKLDENLNFIDTFKSAITPKYYTKMQQYVKKITGIDNIQLSNGEPFSTAFKKFQKWCGAEFRLITWGYDDIPMLKDNILLHKFDVKWVQKAYNLQVIFNEQITGEKRQYSLSSALELLHLEQSNQAHDALNDALDTAKICHALQLTKGIAEYDTSLAKMQSNTHAQRREFFGYNSKAQALQDEKITTFICPNCGELMRCKSWSKQDTSKQFSTISCKEHDKYFVRLNFRNAEDGKINVRRIIRKKNKIT